MRLQQPGRREPQSRTTGPTGTQPQSSGSPIPISAGRMLAKLLPMVALIGCKNLIPAIPECGNNEVEAGEACDDGNTVNSDGCRSDCNGAEVCGDGLLDEGEVCDDGNTSNGDNCLADCSGINPCGNGVIEGTEACDDQNNAAGDGCDPTCIIEPGFTCAGVPSVCQQTCGNAIIDPPEECDDGNNINADGCEADCTNPACQNRIEDPGELCFGTATRFFSADSPQGFDLADIDNDSTLDIITANSNPRNLSIFFGDNVGNFSAQLTFMLQVPVPASEVPSSVVARDLDLDGDIDLATTDTGTDFVTLILQDQVNFLSFTRTLTIGAGAEQIIAEDLDGDNLPELITADSFSDTVSVLFNQGGGVFLPPQTLDAGSDPRSVVTADFNNDGPIDILAANSGDDTLSLFTPQNGNFVALGQPILVGDGPEFVIAANLDADGNIDVVTANQNADTLSVLFGNGDGTFSAPLALPAGIEPFAVAAGDLDGDGDLDLAVANAFVDSSGAIDVSFVSIISNIGNRAFSAPLNVTVGERPESIRIADLNEDLSLDIVTGNEDDDSISVLLNAGNGTFVEQKFLMSDGQSSLVAGDLTGDGLPELFTADAGSDTATVYINFGQGQFGASLSLHMGFDADPKSLRIADINSDGALDMAIANDNIDTVTLILGGGNNVFSNVVSFPTGNGPTNLLINDVDEDGDLDLLTSNETDDTVSILFQGNNTFTLTSLLMGNGPNDLLLLDVDTDGFDDLITANAFGDNITIRPGQGGGFFGASTAIAAGDAPIALAAGDLNGDGFSDLVTANQNSSNLTIFVGDGAGGFITSTLSAQAASGDFPTDVVLEDIDFDGDLDVLVCLANANAAGPLMILLNDGNASFVTGPTFNIESDIDDVVFQDVTGDGFADLILASGDSDLIAVIPGEP